MDNSYNPKQLPSKEERHKLFGSVPPGPRTKPHEKEKMKDLQNTKQNFLFELDAVGISNVKHPIKITSSMYRRHRRQSVNSTLLPRSPKIQKEQI